MRRHLMGLVFLGAYQLAMCAGAFAQTLTAAKFCATVNQVADGPGLSIYSNAQIENGLCMTSREMVKAISNDDSVTQAVCNPATVAMYQEFLRRFPGRDPKSVVGRC
jgi:hypothetical protein